jgi:hypothetical protein
MPKLIDADKLLEYLNGSPDGYISDVCYEGLKERIESGTFDPTPPVQPDTPDHAEKLKETSPCHPYAGSIQFPTTQPRDRPQRGDHIHPDTGRTC